MIAFFPEDLNYIAGYAELVKYTQFCLHQQQ